MNASGPGPPILPDLLRPGLRLVFCGTAAGTVSGGGGPRLLAPAEYPLLLDWGVGLTDLAKYVSGMDRELPAGSLGDSARKALSRRIEAARPAILAFTSLTAGRRYLKRDAGLGEQAETIGATRIWLLPSPSPTATWNWEANKSHWRALARRAASL
jgi:double-stranded uracil-DNA glycosylase